MLEKRPIVTITIGYIIGIIIGLYFKESVALLLVISLIYLININKKGFKLISIRRYARYIKIIFTKKVIFIIIISAIVSNIAVLNQNKKFSQIYEELCEKEEIAITVRIMSNKQEKQYRNVYKAKYKSIYFLINTPKKFQNLEYGQVVKLNGKYVEPDERRNYKGFDYKKYLKTQKIAGTIEIQETEVEITNENIIEKVVVDINKITNEIFLRIKQTIEKDFNEENANLLLGMFLGHTENIEEEVKEKFTKSNLSHILAVSGMHVSFLILSINFIFGKMIGKKYCRIVSIFIIIMYMLITGSKPSIVRTVIMTIFFLLGKLIYRKSDVWQNISLAALALLIYNPFLITNPSAILSFAGTFAIIMMQEYIGKSYIKLSLAVWLILIPIMAIVYNQIALTSLIISTFIVFLIEPLMILSLIYLFVNIIKIAPVLNYLIKLINLLLDGIKGVIDFGSKLPLARVYIFTPSLYQVILYYFIMFILIFLYKIYHTKKKSFSVIRAKNLVSLLKFRFRENKNKVISSILAISIILNLISIIPKDLRIYFVDVGQGDCTLVITPKNRTILIDGGGSESFNVGEKTVIPYLLARKVKKLDYIIISHFDEDHYGGIKPILENLKVKNVVIPKQIENSENYKYFVSVIKKKKINVIVAKQNDTIKIEKDLRFEILWPGSEIINENKMNNNALVCKMIYKDFSMLFTGDIEKEAESILVNEYEDKLKATILKVGHHGSKTSSTQEFLEAVQSKIALIGVGKNNKFGHPNSEVIDRIENLKCKIYRTDRDGEISIKVNNRGKMYKITKFINNK